MKRLRASDGKQQVQSRAPHNESRHLVQHVDHVGEIMEPSHLLSHPCQGKEPDPGYGDTGKRKSKLFDTGIGKGTGADHPDRIHDGMRIEQ